MPAGLQLRTDCTISGRPSEIAEARLQIRVAAAGVINTIVVNAEIQVNGPILAFPNRALMGTLAIGEVVNDDPTVSNWTPAPDLVSNWTYAIVSGTLPPGLALDPTTGRIAGTAQVGGVYNTYIQATLQTQFGSFQPFTVGYAANVDVPTLGYSADPLATPVAYVSHTVFDLAPDSRRLPAQCRHFGRPLQPHIASRSLGRRCRRDQRNSGRAAELQGLPPLAGHVDVQRRQHAHTGRPVPDDGGAGDLSLPIRQPARRCQRGVRRALQLGAHDHAAQPRPFAARRHAGLHAIAWLLHTSPRSLDGPRHGRRLGNAHGTGRLSLLRPGAHHEQRRELDLSGQSLRGCSIKKPTGPG